MELKFPLPRVTTITAVTNIYLLLSLTAVQVYATHKPEQVTSSDNHQDQGDTDQSDITKVGDIVEVAQVREIPENYILSFSKLTKRSLDSYYYYDDEDFFRPSVKFESNKESPSLKKSSFANSHGYRDRQRHSNAHAQPNRNNSPRPTHRNERKDSYQRDVRKRYQSQQTSESRRRPVSHRDQDVSYSQRQKPYRRQSSSDRYRPQHQPQVYFDYEDFDYNYGPPEHTKRKPQNLLEDFMNFLKPKRKSHNPEPDLNAPSLEWLYNDIPEEKDELFIPNNSDYDEGNIDFRDPVYDFKDVIHSIRNNETRIQTLKKFLSAASSFSDKAGTDPVTALTTMPVTILSILGVFYAVSAVAVLGYKYTLFTAGNTNGQAVALIPVAILFAIPLIAALVFVTARTSIDGKISLTRLARGDTNWLRPDFDSVDFMYDVGVGATALLGLGWVVSIAV